MDVISSDDVSRSATANIDAVSVVELLHDMVDLVVFDEIVMRVEIGANVFQSGLAFFEGNFVFSNGSYHLSAVGIL